MIETALVYIFGGQEGSPFRGCGVVVEGSFIATCRHVWRDATRGEEGAEAIVEFPRARRNGAAERRAARLASPCEGEEHPPLDLVLLMVLEPLPPGVTALRPASDARFETGKAVAFARIRRAGAGGRTEWQDEVQVDGRIRDGRPRLDGRRQFTGDLSPGYWFERGSSGSPLFLDGGEQLAGLLSLSELGANEGKSDLKEAFIVPGLAIRHHLSGLMAEGEARRLGIPRESLQPLLDQIGAGHAPLAEIPARLHDAVVGARALAAQPRAPTDDGQDIDGTIAAVREQAGRLQLSDALATLDAKLAEEEALRARRMLPLLRERARLQALTFDGAKRVETLSCIAAIDADQPGHWFDLGDAQRTAGRREEAKAAYERGRAAAERAGDLRGLAIGRDLLGDMLLAEGQRGAALGAYQAAQELRAALGRQTPNLAILDREQSVSQERIGNVLLAEGRWEAALHAYRAALALREKVAGQDSANPTWQRDLAVIHEKIGNVLLAEGDRNAALHYYQTALAICYALTRLDPDNALWQRDLSVSHEKVGDVLLANGQAGAALDAYRSARALREGLVRHDRGNAGAQRDLAVSHSSIGDALLAEGRRDEALDAYSTALALHEALARLDPGNMEWQRDLSISHQRIGGVLLAERKGEDARHAFGAGIAICESLARLDSGNAEWQRDLLVACVKMAGVQPDAARRWLERASSVEKGLRETGRLAKSDEWMAADLRQRLDRLPPAPPATPLGDAAPPP